MVEVEWEDSYSVTGWQADASRPRQPSVCRSVGYVYEDNEIGLGLSESFSDRPVTGRVEEHGYGDSLFIPRSAIRKVWELRRKR